MAGIYIHVPFCRSACTYCDFYFTVNPARKPNFVEAVQQEIQSRCCELTETIETIYFGGGTPSSLSVSQIESILNQIFRYFSVSKYPEITLEANPEDISLSACTQYLSAGVSRLSIGVQSFSDVVLQRLNRSHTAKDAQKALETALSVGFKSVSADVIYGIPISEANSFSSTIAVLLAAGVPHISAYALTVEQRTKLNLDILRKRFPGISEEQQVSECNELHEKLLDSGYERYEISNYARQEHYSRHNLGYWNRRPYLGFGPSAHSFVKGTRSWNLSSVSEYVRVIQNNQSPVAGQEILTGNTAWNDFVLTKLRTAAGFTWQEAAELTCSIETLQSMLLADIEIFKKRGWMQSDPNRVALTPTGFLFANQITSSLFL